MTFVNSFAASVALRTIIENFSHEAAEIHRFQSSVEAQFSALLDMDDDSKKLYDAFHDYLSQSMLYIPNPQIMYCALHLAYNAYKIEERESRRDVEIIEPYMNMIVYNAQPVCSRRDKLPDELQSEWTGILWGAKTEDEAVDVLMQIKYEYLNDCKSYQEGSPLERGYRTRKMVHLFQFGVDILDVIRKSILSEEPWQNGLEIAEAVYKVLYRYPEDVEERIPLISSTKYNLTRTYVPEENIVIYATPDLGVSGITRVAKRFFVNMKGIDCVAILESFIVMPMVSKEISQIVDQTEGAAARVCRENAPSPELEKEDIAIREQLLTVNVWNATEENKFWNIRSSQDEVRKEIERQLIESCKRKTVFAYAYKKVEDDELYNGYPQRDTENNSNLEVDTQENNMSPICEMVTRMEHLLKNRGRSYEEEKEMISAFDELSEGEKTIFYSYFDTKDVIEIWEMRANVATDLEHQVQYRKKSIQIKSGVEDLKDQAEVDRITMEIDLILIAAHQSIVKESKISLLGDSADVIRFHDSLDDLERLRMLPFSDARDKLCGTLSAAYEFDDDPKEVISALVQIKEELKDVPIDNRKVTLLGENGEKTSAYIEAVIKDQGQKYAILVPDGTIGKVSVYRTNESCYELTPVESMEEAERIMMLYFG